jgi:hypothetical protein
MELKKGPFLNIQGQGQLVMLKNEDILAWTAQGKHELNRPRRTFYQKRIYWSCQMCRTFHFYLK